MNKLLDYVLSGIEFILTAGIIILVVLLINLIF